MSLTNKQQPIYNPSSFARSEFKVYVFESLRKIELAVYA
jgi:hypothetical protein